MIERNHGEYVYHKLWRYLLLDLDKADQDSIKVKQWEIAGNWLDWCIVDSYLVDGFRGKEKKEEQEIQVEERYDEVYMYTSRSLQS